MLIGGPPCSHAACASWANVLRFQGFAGWEVVPVRFGLSSRLSRNGLRRLHSSVPGLGWIAAALLWTLWLLGFNGGRSAALHGTLKGAGTTIVTRDSVRNHRVTTHSYNTRFHIHYKRSSLGSTGTPYPEGFMSQNESYGSWVT